MALRLFERLSRKKAIIRQLRRKGDQAMAQSRWEDAARQYGAVLRLEPLSTIQIQYGHALKEAGDLPAAERAYGAVQPGAPEWHDARYHQACVLIRMGQKEGAIALLVAILADQPSHHGAFAELSRLNARDRLPDDFRDRLQPGVLRLLHDETGRLRRDLEDWADVATYAPGEYSAYRQHYPIRPPDDVPHDMAIHVLVDGRDSEPAYLRATLIGLLDQTVRGWSATIFADEAVREHSVASLAAQDSRISFADLPKAMDRAPAAHLLHISAGTLLDPQAIAWFAFGAARSGAAAIWCDHDHAAESWSGTLVRCNPCLWGCFDVDMIAETASPPIAVLLAPSARHLLAIAGDTAQEARRRALLRADAAKFALAHIARPLASALSLPLRAVGAPNHIDPIRRHSLTPGSAHPAPGPLEDTPFAILPRGARPSITIMQPSAIADAARIQVIIQTRDAAASLREAVDSLRDLASKPDRVEITIVDNRSREIDTHDYLATLESAGTAHILPLDEPFNWARANNLAAAHSDTHHIVFANNDITMLTAGWDGLIAGYLERRDVGVVGVRLLYPDGSIQHAGILFGVGDAGLIHDGIGANVGEAGPLDRWDVTRAVPAVTGAFLACSRATFNRVGGFDAERFAIAYNDVDFCLAVRLTGAKILYTPAIELIHHESLSRGRNVGRGKIAWDLGEWASFREKWPDHWSLDPGYNIQWSRLRAFDGFRDPSNREITEAMLRGAAARPWMTQCQADTAQGG